MEQSKPPSNAASEDQSKPQVQKQAQDHIKDQTGLNAAEKAAQAKAAIAEKLNPEAQIKFVFSEYLRIAYGLLAGSIIAGLVWSFSKFSYKESDLDPTDFAMSDIQEVVARANVLEHTTVLGFWGTISLALSLFGVGMAVAGSFPLKTKFSPVDIGHLRFIAAFQVAIVLLSFLTWFFFNGSLYLMALLSFLLVIPEIVLLILGFELWRYGGSPSLQNFMDQFHRTKVAIEQRLQAEDDDEEYS